jgi:ribosomal protein S12 methylthiotransferase accessory factor
MVYMPYSFDAANGEHPIGQRISTGLACHTTRTEAAVTAICEVIERDAITITWQAKLGMPRIILSSLSDHNLDLVNRFERTGNTVTLFDLRLDHRIPTVLSVFRGNTPHAPALAFAASSHLDPEIAVRKSIEELAHTLRMAQQIKTIAPPFICTCNYANVQNQNDHVHLYCDSDNFPLAEFIFSGADQIDFDQIENAASGDPQPNLDTLVKRINSTNHRVLLKDVTSDDVSELGLSVMRAIIPGYHPLFLGHRVRALGGTRLWEIPQKLGYRGISQSNGDNPAPHPFP